MHKALAIDDNWVGWLPRAKIKCMPALKALKLFF